MSWIQRRSRSNYVHGFCWSTIPYTDNCILPSLIFLGRKMVQSRIFSKIVDLEELCCISVLHSSSFPSLFVKAWITFGINVDALATFSWSGYPNRFKVFRVSCIEGGNPSLVSGSLPAEDAAFEPATWQELRSSRLQGSYVMGWGLHKRAWDAFFKPRLCTVHINHEALKTQYVYGKWELRCGGSTTSHLYHLQASPIYLQN